VLVLLASLYFGLVGRDVSKFCAETLLNQAVGVGFKIFHTYCHPYILFHSLKNPPLSSSVTEMWNNLSIKEATVVFAVVRLSRLSSAKVTPKVLICLTRRSCFGATTNSIRRASVDGLYLGK